MQSVNRLVKFKNKEDRDIDTYFRLKYLEKENKIDLDAIEDDLFQYSVGKTKLDFKSCRTPPVIIYLTHEEDLTILAWKYQSSIHKIYRILTKG